MSVGYKTGFSTARTIIQRSPLLKSKTKQKTKKEEREGRKEGRREGRKEGKKSNCMVKRIQCLCRVQIPQLNSVSMAKGSPLKEVFP